MIFSASAPGSLMLFGEHAVLHGKQALCCAINQRIRVNLTPRDDDKIQVVSPLGHHQTDLNSLRIVSPFEFVLTAIAYFRKHFVNGFNLEIAAEFTATMGLGSSSAVTVATVGVLAHWLGLNYSSQQLFIDAKNIILAVQGVGSGADVAAAVFGGIVAYQLQPLTITPFLVAPEITLVYSGAKTPTKTVIAFVAEKQRDEPQKYQDLYGAIHLCAVQAVMALRDNQWQELGKLMNRHHELQAQLGVSTPLLDELAGNLRGQTGIYGAKISGSGLGDCVVALGVAQDNLFPLTTAQRRAGVAQIPVKISPLGYLQEIR